MARYALPSHVFACLDEDQIVLLDLKQDRYFSFDAGKIGALQTIVDGWPASSRGTEGAAGEAQRGDRLARQLADRGLLTLPELALRRPPMPIAIADAELVWDQYDTAPRRSVRSIMAFFIATMLATVFLRLGSLERAVHRVRKRRARRDSTTSDIERTRELLAVFTDLRPFLFTSRDECLFESLVLIEFLARHGIFPSWVFGVQSRPFAAHCWVQQGDTVLNDTLEHLSRYTPIMAA